MSVFSVRLFKNPIQRLGISLFFEMQVYLLPFSLIFYYQNGLSTGDFFLFQSIFFFVSLLLEIPTGYISDLISQKHVIVLAYLFNCLRLILFLTLKGYYIVLAGEICYACCKSFLSGSIDSYVYNYLKQNNSTKMLSKYSHVSAYMSFGTAWASLTSALFYQFWGIFGILIVELISSVIGLFIVFSLPNISGYQKGNVTLENLFTGFRYIEKKLFLLFFILFTAFCFSATGLFCTSFQPILKSATIPPIFFSLVYFFNHLTRGVSSRFTKEIIRFFGIKLLLFVTIILIALSFTGFYFALDTHKGWFALLILFVSCISIAIHLSIQNYTISELHAHIPQSLHASYSSAMSMILKCMSGLILYTFKITADKIGSQSGYILFGCIFFILMSGIYSQIIRHSNLKTV